MLYVEDGILAYLNNTAEGKILTFVSYCYRIKILLVLRETYPLLNAIDDSTCLEDDHPAQPPLSASNGRSVDPHSEGATNLLLTRY